MKVEVNAIGLEIFKDKGHIRTPTIDTRLATLNRTSLKYKMLQLSLGASKNSSSSISYF